MNSTINHRTCKVFLCFFFLLSSSCFVKLNTCWRGQSFQWSLSRLQWAPRGHSHRVLGIEGDQMMLCSGFILLCVRSYHLPKALCCSPMGVFNLPRSLSRVVSTPHSRGVSYSAEAELRGMEAARARWAWRGSPHPETSDYFTGTKLC